MALTATTSSPSEHPTEHPGALPCPGDVRFLVRLRDGSDDVVDGADAYQQEQSMTTFFRTDGRRTVDCWAVRVASFRTDEILTVRRLEVAPAEVVALRPA
jgi:hypothetical protein